MVLGGRLRRYLPQLISNVRLMYRSIGESRQKSRLWFITPTIVLPNGEEVWHREDVWSHSRTIRVHRFKRPTQLISIVRHISGVQRLFGSIGELRDSSATVNALWEACDLRLPQFFCEQVREA